MDNIKEDKNINLEFDKNINKEIYDNKSQEEEENNEQNNNLNEEENQNLEGDKNNESQNHENNELLENKENNELSEENKNIENFENKENSENNDSNESKENNENEENIKNKENDENNNIQVDNNINIDLPNEQDIEKQNNINSLNEIEKIPNIEYHKESGIEKKEEDINSRNLNQENPEHSENIEYFDSQKQRNSLNLPKGKNKNEKRQKMSNKSNNYKQKILKNKAKMIKEQFGKLYVRKVDSEKVLKKGERVQRRTINKLSASKNQSSSRKIIKNGENSQNEEIRTSKVNIFNNKKNNDLCSELLKATMKNEKNLFLIPYAKKKEKVNKNFHTIGDANGISYPNLSVVNGILLAEKSYVNIIRNDDRKSMISRKSKKLGSSMSRKYGSKSPQSNGGNNFKEINIQDFNL